MFTVKRQRQGAVAIDADFDRLPPTVDGSKVLPFITLSPESEIIVSLSVNLKFSLVVAGGKGLMADVRAEESSTVRLQNTEHLVIVRTMYRTVQQ